MAKGQAMRAIIMAAGKGTRLKSDLPKVLHPLFGRPLLLRVLDTLKSLAIDEACVIVGHGREQVADTLPKAALPFPVTIAVQEPQLGTGHAVQQVPEQAAGWREYQGAALILSGDVPLLREASLKRLMAAHQAGGHGLTLLTAELDKPFGYGRVVVENGEVRRIVEEKDASPDEKRVRTINTGVYCLQWEKIAPLLNRLSSDNAQGEFYLTDVVGLAVEAGLSVGVAMLDEPDEMTGVNSRADLVKCHDVLNRWTQARLMADGVTILNPATTMIAPEVRIGADTTILPGCLLQGDITIGRYCEIGPHTTLTGRVELADHVKIIHSMVRDSKIGEYSDVGPFSHLRDDVVLSHHVHIGNFVEIKKTTVDHHTNAAHLAYLGDATLGHDVNIGAGTITANYDPVRDIKEQTVLEDGAKVGSNSVLIAPVTIGEQASVAAGSVITKDVAPWDLAIARGRQTVIAGWVKRVKEQVEAASSSSSS